MIDFNINDYVLVKLTKTGRDELRKQHNDLRQMYPTLKPYRTLNKDAEGYTKFQLWSLMEQLGHLVGFGNDLPFTTDIKLQNTPESHEDRL